MDIKQKLSFELRKTFIWDAYERWRQNHVYSSWLASGKTIPTPHIVKRDVVKKYAKLFGLRVFVETGTYFGDMVNAVKDTFEEIHSIELSPELCAKAKKRFKGLRHINIIEGDSGAILGSVLSHIDRPILFWLDGHYSAGITAKGIMETPIQMELSLIAHFQSNLGSVILIDDAISFSGIGDYPKLESIKEWARISGYSQFEVEEGIIRISR